MNLRKAPSREFDLLLLFAAGGLTLYGVLLIYSGSLTTHGQPAQALSHPVTRQVAFAVLGVIGMVTLSRFDYRLFGPLSVSLYAASVAALLFVLVVGESAYGSRRWIEIAGTQVQPSEIAKVCTVIMLAKYLSDNEDRIRTLPVFLISLLIAALPALLVLIEPDLGSALVFGVLWLAMMVVAGARPLHLVGLAGIAAVVVPLLLVAAAHDYQRERITIWRDPESDPLGSGFNILQAEISIGAGQLWGKGFTHGTQTQLDYLRTQTTDYIFSVAAEELGFVGAMVLFALFILLLFRCLRVAGHAEDSFGRLIAVGIVASILFQVFVNVGVNIRLIPVTGIPLPLVSQGGSSLVTVLGALGIVQSVLGYRRVRGRRA